MNCKWRRSDFRNVPTIKLPSTVLTPYFGTMPSRNMFESKFSRSIAGAHECIRASGTSSTRNSSYRCPASTQVSFSTFKYVGAEVSPEAPLWPPFELLHQFHRNPFAKQNLSRSLDYTPTSKIGQHQKFFQLTKAVGTKPHTPQAPLGRRDPRRTP
jgi:hypothetical protein